MTDPQSSRDSRLHRLAQALSRAFHRLRARAGEPEGGAGSMYGQAASAAQVAWSRAGRSMTAVAVVAAAGWLLWTHPLVLEVPRGEIALRTNRLSGDTTIYRAGAVLTLPALHEARLVDLRDQVYRPQQSARADGPAPFQSVEGLSLGVDLAVRWAVDPSKVGAGSRELPHDLTGDVVAPAVQGVMYRVFTRYTVREIFSSKRAEIQQVLETEMRARLAADGLLLRGVQIGQVDLPPDYRHGMESMLAEEIATEKMRYTLEMKDKQVRASELDAEADRVRRDKAAEASGDEQVIAAKAQEEAMKHVLPFKQQQIQQRQLEAEAETVARIKTAEASAQARRIEAAGEADSRQKLADAEAYRLDRVGRIASEQMARDGALVTQHPLLIQKTLADKLSDKIQVIIAPPPADGGFIGQALVGGAKATPVSAQATTAAAEAGDGSDAAKEAAQ